MNYLTRLLFIVLFFFLSIGKSYASDDLKNYLLKFMDTKNYPYHLLNDEYHAYVKSEGFPPMYFNKRNLRKMMEEQNTLISNFEVINLTILNSFDTEFFTSVIFECDYKFNIGNTNFNVKSFFHTIMEKTETGWIVIFDAQSQ